MKQLRKGATPFLEFESPLPHITKQLKPVPVAGFNFSTKNSVKTVPSIYHYREPKLVRAKHGWYVEYYYLVPVDLRHLFGNKKWARFRDKHDLNRRKGEERDRYANWIVTETSYRLRNGFNPLEAAVEYVESNIKEVPDVISAKEAFQMFIEAWSKRGLEPSSLAKYKKCVNRLAEYLHKKTMLYNDVKDITINHIEDFLNDGRKTYGFSNREYNNTYDFIRTCFNYLVKKELISKSPCAGVDKLKTNSTKHRFYDADTLKAITKALLISDPYTYLAVQTVYYLCIRSDKELMNLKVGNIQWEQNKILLDAGGTKGKAARYIPMDDNIKDLFLKHGVDKYPYDYYVFGIKGEPSPVSFGTGFFAKRFRKVRETAELSKDFTIYGFKHTRVVHLKSDGLDDSTIMHLTGHKDFVAYAKYLRDLGLSANPDKINAVSRKV